MRTIEKTLLTFAELNAAQKEQALDHHRDWNVEGFDWWGAVYEDAQAIGALMGIDGMDISFSGFWSQGDGASFRGSFSYPGKNVLTAVKDHAPVDAELHRIAKEIQDLYRRSFYGAHGRVTTAGNYSHSHTMDVDVETERGAADWEEWRGVLRDFADWIYARLEKEHEYLTSDECVAESLIANEHEFEVDPEDGDIVEF